MNESLIKEAMECIAAMHADGYNFDYFTEAAAKIHGECRAGRGISIDDGHILATQLGRLMRDFMAHEKASGTPAFTTLMELVAEENGLVEISKLIKETTQTRH